MLVCVVFAFVLAAVWLPVWVEQRAGVRVTTGPTAPGPATASEPFQIPELIFGPNGMRATLFKHENAIILTESRLINPRMRCRSDSVTVSLAVNGTPTDIPLEDDTVLVLTFDMQWFKLPLPKNGLAYFEQHAEANERRTTQPLYDLLHETMQQAGGVARLGDATTGT